MRALKLREPELELGTASKIIMELDRIKRNREQFRHNNSNGFMYIVFIRKIDAISFEAHLGGPDTDFLRQFNPIDVKFRVTQNEFGEPQIRIGRRDRHTTYEEALMLAKHSLNKLLKDLPKKPYVFDEGLKKDNWNGYYFSYSGAENKLNDKFDEIFDRAVAEFYVPSSMRETCRDFGFNIKPEPWYRGLTRTVFQQDQLEQKQQ